MNTYDAAIIITSVDLTLNATYVTSAKLVDDRLVLKTAADATVTAFYDGHHVRILMHSGKTHKSAILNAFYADLARFTLGHAVEVAKTLGL